MREIVELVIRTAREPLGPLGVVRVVDYAVELTDAVTGAHRKGITHRDLKPLWIRAPRSIVIGICADGEPLTPE